MNMDNYFFSIFVVIAVLGWGYYAIRQVSEERKRHESGEVSKFSHLPKKLSSIQKRVIGIISSVFIILGFGLIASGILEYTNAEQTLLWPSTTGKVIESKIYATPSTGPAGMIISGIVKTQYFVQGIKYETHNVDSLGYAQAGHNVQHVKKYPKGASVDVFYNPNNPSQALLETHEAIEKNGLMVMVIGGVILVIGILGIVVSRGKINLR